MASTIDELLAAIAAVDVARVREILDTSPEMGSARDRDGVSALMHARYRGADGVIAEILARAASARCWRAVPTRTTSAPGG